MRKGLTRIISFISLTLLFSGCSNNKPSSSSSEYVPFFEDIAADLSKGMNEEKTYYTFYESGDNNRFNAELYYDLHFGLAIKITEYDLRPNIFHANEGSVSIDKESITLVNSALEKSELFSRGTYVLSHQISNGVDTFLLTANDKSYPLSLDIKEDPHYICRDLVGEFECTDKFNVIVTVGEKIEGYPVSISLNELDKTFIASNIINDETSTSFSITGNSNGEYLRNSNNVTLEYKEGNDTFSLSIDNQQYNLIKTKDMEEKESEADNYFIINAERLMFSCDDFEVRLSYEINQTSIYLIFNEKVEGGRTNFRCLFAPSDNEDSIENYQSITNPNNKIFINVDQYVFKHTVKDNKDVVDLYFDDELAYSDLTIEEITD